MDYTVIKRGGGHPPSQRLRERQKAKKERDINIRKETHQAQRGVVTEIDYPPVYFSGNFEGKLLASASKEK